MTCPPAHPKAEASSARHLERATAKTVHQAKGRAMASLSGAKARGAKDRARCQLWTMGQVLQEGIGTHGVCLPGFQPQSLGCRRQHSHHGRLHQSRLHGRSLAGGFSSIAPAHLRADKLHSKPVPTSSPSAPVKTENRFKALEDGAAVKCVLGSDGAEVHREQMFYVEGFAKPTKSNKKGSGESAFYSFNFRLLSSRRIYSPTTVKAFRKIT